MPLDTPLPKPLMDAVQGSVEDKSYKNLSRKPLGRDGKYKKLNQRQREFVLAYIACRNVAQASAAAGYTVVTGYQLLQDPRVRILLAEADRAAMEGATLDGNRIVQEWASIAFANVKRVLQEVEVKDPKTGEVTKKMVIDIPSLSLDDAAAISEVSCDTDDKGSTKVRLKFHSKMEALTNLAALFQLFDKKKEDDRTLTISVIDEMLNDTYHKPRQIEG